ncbi:MAG: sigma-70 family RNA polymerase sigma factor [Deltaproteobacteria bacterium]|nr:sigma-70 family RNA polymerase sigma factor [Deltaproteobacteria bacterium]
MSKEQQEIPWLELASRLQPFIARRIASNADAEDVRQDVLLRMHRALPSLADDDHLTAWMYRIARNAIIDHQRKQRPLRSELVGTTEQEATTKEDEEKSASELAQYLGSFVALLPSPYREAITLTEIEGRSQKDAAEMLGIPTSTMKSRVQRGRVRLQKMLGQCCEIALDARRKVIGFEPRIGCEGDDDCCS